MTSNTPSHLWRSPLLGEPRQVDLPHGRIEYFERGSGPAVVFVHGWLANANLWRQVIDDLAQDFRCLTVDMPLGAHRIPLAPDADLTPRGCASIVIELLDELALDSPTLVGNDSGGAYSQIATAADPSRVGRLVLNACETPFDRFPPPPFDGLPAVARNPAQLKGMLEALRDPDLRTSEAAFGLLIKKPLDRVVSDSYALPSITDEGVLGDIARVMAATTPDAHHLAGRSLIENSELPVLVAWNNEDRVFPPLSGQRYADALPNATFTAIEDSYAFTPEDQPTRLAGAIRGFASRYRSDASG
jgi:pimeloyl-ACP methyl ester carboxylesterase